MKAKPQVRIAKADIKDLIRDELYAYKLAEHKLVIIPIKEVRHIAKKIADRAIVGH